MLFFILDQAARSSGTLCLHVLPNGYSVFGYLVFICQTFNDGDSSVRQIPLAYFGKIPSFGPSSKGYWHRSG